MSKKDCPLCDRKVDENDLVYHHEMEEVVLEVIKKNHPKWVDGDGACPRCLEYYRAIFGLDEKDE